MPGPNPNLVARVAADFDLFDGVQAVTYRQHNEAGTATSTTAVPKALKRATLNALFVDGQLIADDEKAAWHLPTASLPGLRPGKGDTITEANGTVWVVWMVEVQSFATRYRLTCVRR